MAAFLLDAGTTIMCPHGGTVTLAPRTANVSLGGMPPYVVDDFGAPAPVIAGCAFAIGPTPSPCLRVQWLLPAVRVSIGGSPPLLSTSVGLCLNAAGAPQGSAIVSGFQTKVQGQ